MARRRRTMRRSNSTQSKRNIMYFIILVLLVIFMMTVGFRMIINASIWLSGISSDDISISKQSDDRSFLLAPELFDLPDATNSARINVSGRGTADTTLSVFVNDEEYDVLELDEDDFDLTLDLDEGVNEIYLSTEDIQNKRAKDSEVYRISVYTETPNLNVQSPLEGTTVDTDEIQVIGETDPGVSIRVNNSPVVVGSDGSFSRTIRLREGENKITVRAIDVADNEEKVEITVRYERD